MADGVGGPGMTLGPASGVFGIAEIRDHGEVFRQQSEVERVVVGMSLVEAVVDKDRPAVGGVFRLQAGLPVAAEMFTRQEVFLFSGEAPGFLDQGIRIGLKNVVFQAQRGLVLAMFPPGESGETGIPIQFVAPEVQSSRSEAAPGPRPAAVSRIGQHIVEHIEAGFDEEALFELGVFGHEVVGPIFGIGTKQLGQIAHIAGPDKSIAAVFPSHAVAIQPLDQHPGNRVAQSLAFPGKARVEEPVQPLFRDPGPIESNGTDGQGGVRHAGIAVNAAILARCQGFQEEMVLDMTANGCRACLVAEVIALGLVPTEGDQSLIVLYTVEDQVVAAAEPLDDTAFPDTAFDAALAGASLAVLKALPMQGQIVHFRIHVCDAIQEHGGFVGVAFVAGECVGPGQDVHPGLNFAPQGLEAVVGDDVVKVAGFVPHAIAVVDIECMQGIFRVGMLGIEEQRAVAQVFAEHAMFIKGGGVKRAEVVFRVDFAAVFAADFPGMSGIVRPPCASVFRRSGLAAVRAEGCLAVVEDAGIGVDAPGQFLAGHHGPQFVIAALYPGCRRRDGVGLFPPGPVMGLDIRQGMGSHRGGNETAMLFCLHRNHPHTPQYQQARLFFPDDLIPDNWHRHDLSVGLPARFARSRRRGGRIPDNMRLRFRQQNAGRTNRHPGDEPADEPAGRPGPQDRLPYSRLRSGRENRRTKVENRPW